MGFGGFCEGYSLAPRAVEKATLLSVFISIAHIQPGTWPVGGTPRYLQNEERVLRSVPKDAPGSEGRCVTRTIEHIFKIPLVAGIILLSFTRLFFLEPRGSKHEKTTCRCFRVTEAGGLLRVGPVGPW